MAMDFSALKKKSVSGESIKNLTSQLEKLSSKVSYKDDRVWSPTYDKSDNASAKIRFLPAAQIDGEDGVPYVRYYEHRFKGPTGRWYINKSLTSLGKEDPVSEYNSELWNASQDDDSPERKQARAQKRRAVFVSNIYVIDDPLAPENNGKVFLYKYGVKIMEKIQAMLTPKFPDDPKVDVFDFWSGADFKLLVKKTKDGPNYDQSVFATPTPLLKGKDDALMAIWAKQYSLNEFIDPATFKSYEELKKMFESVMGLNKKSTTASQLNRKVIDEDDDDDDVISTVHDDDDDDSTDELLKKFRSQLDD